MPKDSLLKFVSPAAVGGNAAQPSSKAIKKERSLKSLLSLFKLSKHDRSPSLSESRYPNHKPTTKALGFSTASLPAQASKKEDEDGENSDNDSPRTASHWHSTTSLPSQVRPPFARHSPTPSSSSTSSLESPFDASTAATSPSNSSSSVLIRSMPSTSVTAMGSTTSVVNSSLVEYSSLPNYVPVKPLKTPKPPKRVVDGYQKQPSPLSSVMDVHSPYTFPTLPQTSTHENQARRRSSLGNFLLRRSQSHPDLADLTQEDLPPLPPMPASPPSRRPKSPSSSVSRTKSFRRRSADHRKSDGCGGYTDQEKLERISILGADPAGYGYYLYPTSQKETDNQRNSGIGRLSNKRGGPGSVDDWNRSSWGGSSSEGPGGAGAPSGRAWKDSRGRGFRRTVTQQAIPEEVGDASELESIPSQSTGLRQNPTSAEPVLSISENEMTIVAKITSFDERERRQIPSYYDSIQENKKVQGLSLQVPRAQTNVLHDRGQDDKLVLRMLQQRVMDAADSAVEGSDGRVASLGTARSGESTKVVEMKDNLPMVMVEA